MEDYPRNLLEFNDRFSDEDACKAYLYKIRWPNGFKCPRCNFKKTWPTKRNQYRCRKCNLQTSLTSGTIFHRTHKPMRLWFQVMWHVCNQKYGTNALGMQRALGMGSYRIVWEWLHKLRCAMVRPGREKLSGLVEVDETYVGGVKPGKRGRGAEGKTLVLIAVEDREELGFGRIRLRRAADASTESLNKFIQENIETGSTIRTDGWKGYSGLSNRGYQHHIEKQTANVGDNSLYLVHQIASLLKRWLLGIYQGSVQPGHLDYYLDEYTFRFNRRTSTSRGKLFYRLVQQAIAIEPVPGYKLKGGMEVPSSK